MNESPPVQRLRRAAPIVLSIVFVLIAGLVVWASIPEPLQQSPGQPPGQPSATASPPTATPPPQSSVRCEPARGDKVAIADGVLRLGSIYPQPGPNNDSAGAPLIAATQMAVQDVNLAGGIPDLRTPQIALDANLDEGAPGAATACASASRLLASAVDAMVGPYASADTLTIYKRVTQAGRLMVSPSNTLASLSDAPDQGLYFRTAPSDESQADALTNLVTGDRRTNVAVVVEADPFALSLADAVTTQLNARGVVRTTRIDAGSSTYAGIADRVATEGYDGVVFAGFRDIASLVGMVIDRGFTPQNKGFYGSTGLLQNNSADQASPGAPQRLAGLRGFIPWADPVFNERLKSFRPELKDLTYGAQSYDAVIAVALAAAAAGTDDPRSIATKLPDVTRGGRECTTYQACVTILRQSPGADIDYKGVSGPLGFTAKGDVCEGRYNLSAFGPNGKLDQPVGGGNLPSRPLC